MINATGVILHTGLGRAPLADEAVRALAETAPHPQRVEIDEESLRQIADKTDGRYFRAVDKEALAKIYTAIDRLERVEVSELRYLQYTEHFGYVVLSGMGLIGVAFLLNGSIFRKLP